MWPKAFAQLIELAPHVTRLIPVADRFFQNKSASEETHRRAMEAMAEGLRSDIGQATAAHEGLYRQFNDQSEKLAGIAVEVRAAKAIVVATEERIARLEKALKSNTLMLIGVLAINVALLVVAVYFLLHH
jgi:hypothetical protein